MGEQTSLIIVCNDKMMEYANFLVQLIGLKDDGEEIVGIEDGSVSAAIWTEKQYKDNLAQITSDTHILFIGNSKLVKLQAKNVKMIYSQYGMNYGWLGKRAVMFVDDKMLNKEQYDQFFEYAKEYEQNFNERALITWEKVVPIIGGVVPFLGGVLAIGASVGSAIFKKDKMHNQQYSCLTRVLYIEGLKNFLEA